MGKKSWNADLKNANKVKSDEFYTQLSDIEKELWHYKEHFQGKTVFCNCDDPEESHFWKFFELNFSHLWLKKLVSTHYEDSKPSYKLEIIWDTNSDGKINKLDIVKTPLKQNWDFRSPECIEILKEADIVVTNPPFSLFREYVAQLFEYNKKFVIIGNQNAITYRDFFKSIKENKVWFGHSIHSWDREFRVPEDYPLNASWHRVDENWDKFIRVKWVRWYTNLDYKERHEDLILYKKYNELEYPKYDNYDAINVDITKNIPDDYQWEMWVPITFLDKYNPDQFEIIWLWNSRDNFTPNKTYLNPYKIMKDGSKKNWNAINCVLTIEKDTKPNDTYYISDNSKYLVAPYARIIIKNKKFSS